jgi:hypothetical protein
MADRISQRLEISEFYIFFTNTSGFGNRSYLGKTLGSSFFVKINLINTPPSGGQGFQNRMDTI